MLARNNEVHDFDKSLTLEEQWVPKIEKSFFKDMPLKNVSKDPYYQPLGVDALFQRSNGEGPTGIEYKCDRYKTGNLALEFISANTPSARYGTDWTDGWMITSRAGWLLYSFITTGEMLALDMQILRNWLYANHHRFESTSVANKGYFSFCLLVPMHVLLRELPAGSWRYIDMADHMAEKFEKRKMALGWVYQEKSIPEAMRKDFETGTRISSKLKLDTKGYSSLHIHLWTKDRKHTLHLSQTEKRKTILKPWPSLMRALGLASAYKKAA